MFLSSTTISVGDGQTCSASFVDGGRTHLARQRWPSVQQADNLTTLTQLRRRKHTSSVECNGVCDGAMRVGRNVAQSLRDLSRTRGHLHLETCTVSSSYYTCNVYMRAVTR